MKQTIFPDLPRVLLPKSPISVFMSPQKDKDAESAPLKLSIQPELGHLSSTVSDTEGGWVVYLCEVE